MGSIKKQMQKTVNFEYTYTLLINIQVNIPKETFDDIGSVTSKCQWHWQSSLVWKNTKSNSVVWRYVCLQLVDWKREGTCIRIIIQYMNTCIKYIHTCMTYVCTVHNERLKCKPSVHFVLRTSNGENWIVFSYFITYNGKLESESGLGVAPKSLILRYSMQLTLILTYY